MVHRTALTQASVFTVQRKLKSEVGDHRSVGIPGNIPNPAVKRVSADGTWRAASWESKKLPTSLFLFNGPIGTGKAI